MSERTPTLSTASLARLQAHLLYQEEREPAGKPFPRWADLCGHVARTGGFCADCIREEIDRRLKGAKQA